MSNNIVHQLKEAILFRDLPEEVLTALAKKVISRKLAQDDVLMRKGEMGDSLFMIHRGSVKIVTEDSDGRELIINQCGAGETIGEMALLDQAPRSAGAVALEHTEVFELKQNDFRDLLDQRPDILRAIISGFSPRLRFSTTYIEKVVEWSHRIAAGDYSFLEDAPTIPTRSGSDEDKAINMLSAFFQMVRRVKAREEGLKQQLEILAFEIDHSRRQQEVEAITSTEHYARIKEQARRLRERRHRYNANDNEDREAS
jgi:CRP-like cAMP-binding protein